MLSLILPLAFWALTFWLGCRRHVEPFFTYYFFFAWASYLWFLDRLYGRRTGLHLARPWHSLAWLFALSTTVWCVFEALNFRLDNWSYIGVPRPWMSRWTGYALAFGTVIPGLFWTARCLGGEAPHPSAPQPLERRWVVLGIAMLAASLLWPRLFFPLVWGGVFFLIEPLVQRWGGHSLMDDWKHGRWGTTLRWLVSGVICGFYWEFCNFWAGSKWIYHLPYWNFTKVFEMPVLGFIGFPAFALEIHVILEAAHLGWSRLSPGQRCSAVVTCLLFWGVVFVGIDRWTVVGWQ